jgi:ABC-type bacteriocin/lantibiotic exporter with double-glycine peptidase domain
MMKRVRGALVVLGLVAVGCGHGRVDDAALVRAGSDPAWIIVPGVPFIPQEGEADCGAAALAMALAKGGRPSPVRDITSVVPREQTPGMFAGQLRDVARRDGFEAYLISGSLADLETEIGRSHPVVVGLVKVVNDRRFSHYELVIGLRRDGTQIMTMDPASGPRQQAVTTFLVEWGGSSRAALVVWRAR